MVYDTPKVSAIIHKGKAVFRATYGLAMVGETTLVTGGDGIVSVTDVDTERVLFRANVEGKARGLAVADGQVIVTTDRGIVYCFAPGKGDSSATVHDPAAAFRNAASLRPDETAAKTIEQLKNAGV